MGYTRTELTITNIKKESSILNADMQINDSSEYLHVEYDYTTNNFNLIFSRCNHFKKSRKANVIKLRG